jgi:hypothetical protein
MMSFGLVFALLTAPNAPKAPAPTTIAVKVAKAQACGCDCPPNPLCPDLPCCQPVKAKAK